MKKHLLLLFLSTFFLSALCAQHLTVATYNIRYENQGDADQGNGWKQRCPVITQLIRFNDFDIFGSQEVLNGQLNDLLTGLPEYGYTGVGRDDGLTKGEYAPIFYRKDKIRMLESGRFWLSEIQDRPNVGWDAALPRICTWGKFRIKGTKTSFWFFNLHMDHVGEKARLESSKLVLEKIRTMCGKERVILTGDFNVDQTTEGYKLLSASDVLQDSYETATVRYALNGTFNAFDPNLKTDSRIDHVFVGKGIRVDRYGVLTDTYRSEIGTESTRDIKSGNFPKEVSLHQYEPRLPSDHFPVKVELTFTR
jgi:endonuclease/exonuclease/phosphatase family metal-dependent hydrolase